MPTLPASALGFAWPLRGLITSPFGDGHPLGIDIAPVDSLGLVLAARDGVVIAVGGDPCCSYGYYVMLDHGQHITSVYGHFREVPPLRPGDWIERGTVLGTAGETGHSFGVHLHFEVRVNGVPVDAEAALTAGHLTPLPVRPPATTSLVTQLHTDDPQARASLSSAERPVDTGDPTFDAKMASGATTEGVPHAETPPATPVETLPLPIRAPVATSTHSGLPISDPETAAPQHLEEASIDADDPAAVIASPTADPHTTAPEFPDAISADAGAPTVDPETLLIPNSGPTSLTESPTPPPGHTAPLSQSTATSMPTGALTQPVPTPMPVSTPTPAPISSPQVVLPPATAPTLPATPALPAPPTPAAPAGSATPPPTASECEIVRFPATATFIRLEADAATIQSLQARRCGPEEAVVVVAQPAGELRCRAELVVAELSRRLIPLPRTEGSTVAEQQPITEVHWPIAAADLRPGALVRVTCAPTGRPD